MALLLRRSESQRHGEEAKGAQSRAVLALLFHVAASLVDRSPGASDRILQALLALQLLSAVCGRAAQHFSQGSWNVFSAPRGSHEAPGSCWSEEGS